jgi:hypothetical protein
MELLAASVIGRMWKNGAQDRQARFDGAANYVASSRLAWRFRVYWGSAALACPSTMEVSTGIRSPLFPPRSQNQFGNEGETEVP